MPDTELAPWEQPGTVEPALSQAPGDLASSPDSAYDWTGLWTFLGLTWILHPIRAGPSAFCRMAAHLKKYVLGTPNTISASRRFTVHIVY